MKSAIFIPARMGSTRLPNKPLADIDGKPMIVHVMERAISSGVKEVFVACAEKEIFDAVTKFGGKAIMTDPNHPSGTDRIFEALNKSGCDAEIIINLQGDLPSIDPSIITKTIDILATTNFDISTLAAKIIDEHEKTNPNVVKAVISFQDNTNILGKALYFSRAQIPYGVGELYHHIGIYGYRRKALEKFVALPPSPLEKREKLEQLRALENEMTIGIGIVNTVPLGVDTQEDLEIIRNIINA